MSQFAGTSGSPKLLEPWCSKGLRSPPPASALLNPKLPILGAHILLKGLTPGLGECSSSQTIWLHTGLQVQALPSPRDRSRSRSFDAILGAWLGISQPEDFFLAGRAHKYSKKLLLLHVQILFYPTAIGSEPQDPSLQSYPHWARTMTGHSAANLVKQTPLRNVWFHSNLCWPVASVSLNFSQYQSTHCLLSDQGLLPASNWFGFPPCAALKLLRVLIWIPETKQALACHPSLLSSQQSGSARSCMYVQLVQSCRMMFAGPSSCLQQDRHGNIWALKDHLLRWIIHHWQ